MRKHRFLVVATACVFAGGLACSVEESGSPPASADEIAGPIGAAELVDLRARGRGKPFPAVGAGRVPDHLRVGGGRPRRRGPRGRVVPGPHREPDAQRGGIAGGSAAGLVAGRALRRLHHRPRRRAGHLPVVGRGGDGPASSPGSRRGRTGLAWSPDGAWVAFAGDRFGNMDIWKVSVPGGEVHRLTGDPLYEGYPSWAPDSGTLFYVRMDDRWVDHDVIEITPDGRNPRTVVEDRGFFDYRAGRAFGAAQPSPDGEQLLFRSQRSGWLNFWIAPRAGGEARPLAASDHDQSDARWSPDGAWVSYTENQGGVHSLRLAAADGSGSRALVEGETGAALRPEWSPDGDRISYTFETPARPAELFVLDVASGESALAHSEIGADTEPRVRLPEKVSYPSTDGLTIEAYVHRPPDAAPGERFPGMVWIHGGPTSQFDDQFRRHQQVHFFAQRGYVVLMPNIRGSSGYGLAFEDLNNGCWGHCDLEGRPRRGGTT